METKLLSLSNSTIQSILQYLQSNPIDHSIKKGIFETKTVERDLKQSDLRDIVNLKNNLKNAIYGLF